jgi:hypothetical protein
MAALRLHFGRSRVKYPAPSAAVRPGGLTLSDLIVTSSKKISV